MASRLEQARQALQNPNTLIFLDMLAAAEGVEHGYATLFGNTKLENLDDHPRTLVDFTQTDGKKNKSSAAGRYQFLQETWDDVAAKLKLPDFGPDSQNLAAVELLNRAGALQAVLAGDFDTAVQKAGKTWASLPSSQYPQAKRTWDFIRSQLSQNSTQDATLMATATPMPPVDAVALAAQASQPPMATATPMPPADAVATPMPPQAGSLTPAAWASQLPMATATPSPMIPATQPGAVSAVLAALRPQEVAPIETEPVFTAEDDAMLERGLAADVNTQRGQAVANFFGEDYMPDLPLPDALDASINRYLAML
jgi:muramidase (phage lysozyme)